MDDGKEVIRGRMVVEEVAEKPETAPEPKILDEAVKVSSISIPGATSEKSDFTSDQKSQLYQPIKSGFPVFWIIIPGVFLLGAILGGIYFYQKGMNSLSNVPTLSAAPTFVPAVTPTSTPIPISLNLIKYTISIFNGSGISGEAGKVKTLLTTAGFKVGTTANAATYNYTKTIIKAKTSVDSGFVSALSTALGKNYLVDTAQILATSSADDVQVVVGSSKAQ